MLSILLWFILKNIQDNDMKILFTDEDIKKMVSDLACQISTDYLNKNPVLLSVLKGSFIFTADLVRELTIKHTLEFIHLSSYEGQENKDIKCSGFNPLNLVNKDIIIVDDIIDTGNTIQYLHFILKPCLPISIKVCALLSKTSKRIIPVNVDYVGTTIQDHFVVGYGMDLDEHYRNMSCIYSI
jgi:hypoxanthine phosphoribosyltransferase